MTRYGTGRWNKCVSGRGPSRASAELSLGGLLLLEAGIGHVALGALFVSVLVTSRQ